MNEQQIGLAAYDEWLKDDSDVAALVIRQWLEPVGGKDAVIFPPTYARPQGIRGQEEWLGYNIDRFPDGSNVGQIDSVGSQANRIEPLFEKGDYAKLVPQVIIKAGEREVNLLEAGHRAADAIVRFSTLKNELNEAFNDFRRSGNAESLAKIAPTSIIFGSWDSRDTQVKLPRIVGSVIRAYNVEVLHRSAQYTTIAGEILEDGEAEVTTSGLKAELGLAHVPAPLSHGGVIVKGEIRREATLNLSALRALKGVGDNSDTTIKLRRYILGLALVSFTATQETFLREGCHLVPDQNRPAECHVVWSDGNREVFGLPHQESIEYAQLTASDFGVGNDRTETFDLRSARQALTQPKGKSRRMVQGTEEREAGEQP